MSTMFASVAKDGRLELWDLAKDVLDPIAAEKPKDVRDSNFHSNSHRISNYHPEKLLSFLLIVLF